MEEMTHLALLPSAQQDDWEKYLKDNTKKWKDYTQIINDLEQKINTAVCKLFKLSPEESASSRRQNYESRPPVISLRRSALQSSLNGI